MEHQRRKWHLLLWKPVVSQAQQWARSQTSHRCSLTTHHCSMGQRPGCKVPSLGWHHASPFRENSLGSKIKGPTLRIGSWFGRPGPWSNYRWLNSHKVAHYTVHNFNTLYSSVASSRPPDTSGGATTHHAPLRKPFHQTVFKPFEKLLTTSFVPWDIHHL